MAEQGDPGEPGTESETDATLVGRMARGERVALGALYERYAARLNGLVVKILGDRAEAEDLLHDVFLEAWRYACARAVALSTGAGRRPGPVRCH
jgi:RNA polymerase sigma-70 factor (ECF subfamily)